MKSVALALVVACLVLWARQTRAADNPDYTPKATAARLRRVAVKYQRAGRKEDKAAALKAASCAEKVKTPEQAHEIEKAFNKGAQLPDYCSD